MKHRYHEVASFTSSILEGVSCGTGRKYEPNEATLELLSEIEERAQLPEHYVYPHVHHARIRVLNQALEVLAAMIHDIGTRDFFFACNQAQKYTAHRVHWYRMSRMAGRLASLRSR